MAQTEKGLMSISRLHSFSSSICLSGLFCNTSIDGIGTCWPRSSAGEVVSRPCPETFLGVRYNTTSKCQASHIESLFHASPIWTAPSALVCDSTSRQFIYLFYRRPSHSTHIFLHLLSSWRWRIFKQWQVFRDTSASVTSGSNVLIECIYLALLVRNSSSLRIVTEQTARSYSTLQAFKFMSECVWERKRECMHIFQIGLCVLGCM